MLIWSGFATENCGFGLLCEAREDVRMKDDESPMSTFDAAPHAVYPDRSRTVLRWSFDQLVIIYDSKYIGFASSADVLV